jgi:hypothetical protein
MLEVGLWIIEPFVDRKGTPSRRCHPPNSLSPQAVRRLAERSKPTSVASVPMRPRTRIGVLYTEAEMDQRKHLEELADRYGAV